MNDSSQIELPDYDIERELGRGAMAKVYLAVHKGLQRRVALKIMSPALVSNPTFRERFAREARFVAQLDHPHIVTVYDIGVHGAYYYMAMRYIAGGVTLKDRIAEGIDEADAITVIRQIASALECAHQHERRIVHRDIKPANILFDERGNAVLSDFGIAKSAALPGEADEGEDALTMVGQAVGTPAYMSPDQILGHTVDARSDLYSLGVVFYELLTGRKPYQAEETIALAMMHVNEPVPQLPKPLHKYQPVIDRLMAKQPYQRYASATELLDALDRIAPLAGEDATLTRTRARTETLPQPSAPGPRWPRWLLVGGAAIALAGIGVRYGAELLPFGPPCVSPPLDEAAQAEIVRLLEIADLNREVGRLVFPDFSNAAYGYDQVLRIDPCHPEAGARMQELPKLLAAQVRAADAEDEDRALLRPLIEAGLRWAPDNAELMALRRQFSADK